MGRNFCGACGLTFGNMKSFDAHRTGSFGEPIYKLSRTGKSRYVIGHTPHTRRCMILAEIQAFGLILNERGWWTLPKTDESPSQEDVLEKATP